MPAVLFVLTSANKTLTGTQTVCGSFISLLVNLSCFFQQGWYLPEAAHPYYTITKYATVDFAAPEGPNPPIDEGSIKVSATYKIFQ